jgi:hypothetical protein
MRRLLTAGIVGATLFCLPSRALAQNSLDVLEDELKEAKQQHDDVTSEKLTAFFSKIDAAMASPDAALTLYSDPLGANGALPPPIPVTTENENETVSEKTDREALDRANLVRLGTILQLHCGLLHYSALFILKPDQSGLQDQWAAWLKTAATVYPNTAPPPDSNPQSGDQKNRPQHHRHNLDGAAPFSTADIKSSAMRDSIIAKALGFNAWNEKDPSGWAVRDIPRLYQTNVLDPLRTKPSLATLAAWDVYIGMMNADETDNNRWDDVVFPPLQFERSCDAYAVEPSTERIETLVQLIKTYQTNSKVDDWIARVHLIVNGYRESHGLKPSAATGAATTAPSTGTPGVTVTTEQQGDATIVTTHTNSPSANAPTGPNGQAGMKTVPIMDMQSVMSAAPVVTPPPTPAPNPGSSSAPAPQ